MTRKLSTAIWKNAMIVVPVAVLHSLLYQYLTSFASTPFLMRATVADAHIPFLLWTVWPYTGLVIVSIVGPCLVREPAVFREFVSAYLFAVVVLGSTYFLFPNAIERPSHLHESAGWSRAVYRYFTTELGTGCAFPSGHVVFPMLACWAMYRDGIPAARWIALVMAASSFSILTIKEHVLWDWIGGAVVGCLAIVFGTWASNHKQESASDAAVIGVKR